MNSGRVMNAQLNNECLRYTCLGYSLSWDCYSSYSFPLVISFIWRCHESSAADTDGRVAARETSGWAAWIFCAVILVIFTSLLISCLSPWGPDHHHPSLTHTHTHYLSLPHDSALCFTQTLNGRATVVLQSNSPFAFFGSQGQRSGSHEHS